jgi:chromosome segregation ATPase
MRRLDEAKRAQEEIDHFQKEIDELRKQVESRNALADTRRSEEIKKIEEEKERHRKELDELRKQVRLHPLNRLQQSSLTLLSRHKQRCVVLTMSRPCKKNEIARKRN